MNKCKTFLCSMASLILCAFILAGCKGKQSVPQSFAIPTMFTCQVEVSTDTQQIGGLLKTEAIGVYNFTAAYPSSLEGYHVVCAGESYHTEYLGLTADFSQQTMKDSLFSSLFGALITASGGGALEFREVNGDNSTYIGSNEHGNFELTSNLSSGKIQEIIYLDQNIHIRFFDYQ